MNVVAYRVLGAARFDRESYLWMMWNDRAGGDAVLLVLLTDLLVGLAVAGLDPLGILRVIVGGLFFWLIYSGIVYAAGKFLFEGSGQFQNVFRIAGFAYPTRLLIIALTVLSVPWPLNFLLGSAWMVAIVAHGIKEALELPFDKSVLAAFSGLLGYLVVLAIFPRF